jgi:poly-gamma-glutamate capsule biosynthesis protein CapA/YwtB (metallophosphatase superfamily)
MRRCSWTPAVLALLSIGSIASSQSPPGDTGKRVARPLSSPVHVCAGGDVTLGTNLDPIWAKHAADTLGRFYGLRPDPDSLAPALRPFFTGADVVVLNIEGAIGTGPAPVKCGPRSTACFAFRQSPNAATALRQVVDSNVVLVGNVANNHSRDAGDAGRDTTVAYLSAADIRVTGADTLATPIALPSGDTIAILGFHTDTATPDARDLAAVRRHVARAVAEYGTVIVTMHLGAEGPQAQRTRDATERFLRLNRGNPVAFANAALQGGATLVVGHGPHVLRAAEWRGDRLVVYSLGNLLTYGPFKLREPTNRGAVVCATIDSARHVSRAELRPTMQLWPGVLQADSSRRAWTLVDSLSALDFPRTGARVDTNGTLQKRKRP